ncbi:MAG: hypothetical protein KY455_00805 [Euryarchaeota archaeon]|nr:hypothetical protein [Euryarchaeota archaeon]
MVVHESLAYPVALVMGLFMVSYLPWAPECDPVETVCVSAADWSGLLRFVGAWEPGTIVAGLQATGLEAAPHPSGGVVAHDGETRVHLYTYDGEPGQQTVIFLSYHRAVPFAAPIPEERAELVLEATLREAEMELGRIQDALLSATDWKLPEDEAPTWSIVSDRKGGTGGLLRVEASH